MSASIRGPPKNLVKTLDTRFIAEMIDSGILLVWDGRSCPLPLILVLTGKGTPRVPRPCLWVLRRDKNWAFDLDTKAKLKKNSSGGRCRAGPDRRRDEHGASSNIATAPAYWPWSIREDACGFR